MESNKIALVTFQGSPSLDAEDRLLAEAFRQKGYWVDAVCWDQPVQWNSYRGVIVRETWDYWLRYPEFLRWLDEMEQKGIPLLNPAHFLKWNTNKNYLLDLAKKGFLVPPTAWIEPGEKRSLGEIMRAQGWDEAVLKPSISGNGYLTFRLRVSEAEQHQADLEQILRSGTAMLQPFISEILSRGEVSLIFFDGIFSHGVRKKGAPGEFRIQAIHGGSAHAETIPERLLAQGERVLKWVGERLLYARLDMIETNQGPMLMELEATEPSLFFSLEPKAPRNLVEAFERLITPR